MLEVPRKGSSIANRVSFTHGTTLAATGRGSPGVIIAISFILVPETDVMSCRLHCCRNIMLLQLRCGAYTTRAQQVTPRAGAPCSRPLRPTPSAARASCSASHSR